jgi:hypothetical protein
LTETTTDIENYRDEIIPAVYLGCGCFRRLDTQGLAFVRRIYRPGWLSEGERYYLTERKVTGGVLFYVRSAGKP